MTLVIRATGVVIDNPFLECFSGIDVDSDFGVIKCNFGTAGLSFDGYNNIGFDAQAGTLKALQSSSLLNDAGNQTTVEISSDASFRRAENGVTAGSIYPESVSKSYIYLAEAGSDPSPEGLIYFDGLSKKKFYTLKIFASRTGTGNGDTRVARYTANGISGSLDAEDNVSTILLLEKIAPDANGRITLFVETNGSTYGYLNVAELSAPSL